MIFGAIMIRLVKVDNGFKIHIFTIINIKDMKYERRKQP